MNAWKTILGGIAVIALAIAAISVFPSTLAMQIATSTLAAVGLALFALGLLTQRWESAHGRASTQSASATVAKVFDDVEVADSDGRSAVAG